MDEKINVILLIDDEPLYAPYVIKKMLQDLDSSMLLKYVIFTHGNYRKVSEKKNKQQMSYLYGYFNNLLLNIYYNYKSMMMKFDDNQNHYKLLEQYGIHYCFTDNINSDEVVNIIKQQNTDIIFSLTHHILKKDILNAPNLICINRHTGKLPNYAGLMSCLYTMLDQKDKRQITITQTMHTMVEKIDAGEILIQSDYNISRNSSLFYAYSTLYKDTVFLFNKAVKKYLNNEVYVQDIKQRKYYSFPEKTIAKEFRKYYKIFKLNELLTNMGLDINGGGDSKLLDVYAAYLKNIYNVKLILSVPSIHYGRC